MTWALCILSFLAGAAWRNITARRQLVDLTVALQHRAIGRDLRVIKGGRP